MPVSMTRLYYTDLGVSPVKLKVEGINKEP